MPKDLPPRGSVAERIKKLRNAVGLTRRDIEISHKVKSPSLISWEKGHRIPKRDKAELLAIVFQNHGIPCTVDWILKGEGPDPLEVAVQNPEEAYLLKEIHRFQSSHQNSIILQVEDQNMAPWISPGDYVGGLFVDQTDKEQYVDQVCIAKTRDFGTQIRLIRESDNNGLFNLISFSNKGGILNVELEAVARIIFLRRK